jgi:hypothetical protein
MTTVGGTVVMRIRAGSGNDLVVASSITVDQDEGAALDNLRNLFLTPTAEMHGFMQHFFSNNYEKVSMTRRVRQ